MIILSDTSVITNLAAIQQIQLLPLLYEKVTIPEAVYRELVEVKSEVPGTSDVQTAQWIEVRAVQNRGTVEQLQNEAKLDAGESEAIALALEINADLLLIDERRGRAEANRLGIRITGLLGVLIEAKRRNLIEAVKPLIDDLIATSKFRVSSALYSRILDIVDEA